MTERAVPWRLAWESALYGWDGFFRRGRPAEHFRTSAHLTAYAEAVAELARRAEAATVVDVGAGGGELLTSLRRLLGDDVRLVGTEISARPVGLPASIEWVHEVPDHVAGLLVANEWLDNIPCDVVEVDDHGVVREVLVHPRSGQESLGNVYESAWLDDWWPLTEPGERAEVGSTRDDAWADVVARVSGTALAIDYGHVRASRPPFGSLRSYARGREVDVLPDGTRDVTAHVAVDSVAARTGASITTQREALLDLGVVGARPPISWAASAPADYLRALSEAGEAGELLARGGWGDFAWVRHDSTAS